MCQLDSICCQPDFAVPYCYFLSKTCDPQTFVTIHIGTHTHTLENTSGESAYVTTRNVQSVMLAKFCNVDISVAVCRHLSLSLLLPLRLLLLPSLLLPVNSRLIDQNSVSVRPCLPSNLDLPIWYSSVDEQIPTY